MPRNVDPATADALKQKVLYLILLVDLTLNNQTVYVWSGVGNFVVNGNTYVGVGTLGQVTPAQEGVDITAEGASVSLSGVDTSLVADSLAEIQLGAPGKIYLGVLDSHGALIGAPIVLFSGIVDAPTVQVGVERSQIIVPLESRLAVLGSGQQRRLTRADQALTHPDDIAFNWVESLNDLALRWGV